MAATASVKYHPRWSNGWLKITLDDRMDGSKLPQTIEWMAQAAPLRKSTTVKKNEWPVATSLYKWNNTLL